MKQTQPSSVDAITLPLLAAACCLLLISAELHHPSPLILTLAGILAVASCVIGLLRK